MSKDFETENTENIVCPYCGEEIEDWHDMGINDDTEDATFCAECEKEFIFIGHIGEWSFNSFKK